MALACCCVTGGDGIEPWDQPIEPEHGPPTKMSQMDKKLVGQEGKKMDRERTIEEIKIGIVTIANDASQGLELLNSDPLNLVIVAGVRDGPWAKWNETHPDHMVQPGDEIVEVNGKRGDMKEIVAEMKFKSEKKRNMVMVIRRPVENVITVNKPAGDTLGLILAPLDNGLLFIDAIREGGVIHRWNQATNNSLSKVRSLDQVVEVNKKRGNSQDLIEAMKEDGCDIQLVFLTHER